MINLKFCHVNNRKLILNTGSGFTFIELIIYIAIIAVFVVALILLVHNIVLGQVKNQALAEVQNNARLALARMKYEIRQSADINESQSQFAPTNPGTLYLENPSADVIFSVNGDKALTIEIGADPSWELTSSEVEVETLTFQDVSPTADYSAIKIVLTIDYKNPSQSKDWEASVTRTTTVSLRR